MSVLQMPLLRPVFARPFLRELMSVIAVVGALATPVQARVLVVRSDMGGSIEARLQTIAQMRASGTRVEIRGKCASSCTLFLGLPGACVAPKARLGFHGPQSQYYGISLPPDQFEYWSRVMARNYPRSIARWFMADARNTTMGLVTISGAQAIKMGARAC